MTREHLSELVMGGMFFVVGEYRGGRADLVKHVDRKSGLVLPRVIINYVVIRGPQNAVDVLKIQQWAPEAVTDPAQVKIELERGLLYAFELDGLNKERGIFTAYLSLREPEPIE